MLCMMLIKFGKFQNYKYVKTKSIFSKNVTVKTTYFMEFMPFNAESFKKVANSSEMPRPLRF